MNPILVTQKIVILNAENKILSIRRSKTDPTRPLSWDVPGGLVDEGEDLVKSILREVKEEVGIEVSRPELIDAFSFKSESGECLICIGYKAIAISHDVTLSYEHDKFEWLTKDEFLQRDSKNHVRQLVSLCL